MSWKETNVFEERNKFITGYYCYGFSMSELCKAFGVSRRTGYKVVQRYEEEGIEGLYDKSSAPRHHPNETDAKVVRQLLDAKHSHPTWGPRKLVCWLKQKHPNTKFPAVSTAGDILKRHDLVKPKKRRKKYKTEGTVISEAKEPNDVWCGDFKGWFKVKDGKKCEPLTITDARSRYLVACQGLRNTKTDSVKNQFAMAFKEHGLPKAILTDNGPPFSSQGIAGLSVLSIWWLKLGIVPERIDPGHPEQNSSHERMHRTLKQDTAIPPKQNLRQQQLAFDAFKDEYNNERPHEALDDRVPGDFYTSSNRKYPRRIKEFEYPKHFEIRKVRENGCFKWRGGSLFLSSALRTENIGLEQTAEDHWTVHIGPAEIAIVSESNMQVLPYKAILVKPK